jgi:four helix bundle protein
VRRKHHELHAWQQAITLVKEIYRLTTSFPSSEIYGLTAQMRRSAISVPSNIAEGAARNSTGEFLQFLGVARGSLSELETQFILARELGYVCDPDPVAQHIEDTFGLLGGPIKSVTSTVRR